MTCKKSDRCANYKIGNWACDHTGEEYCQNFTEKQTASLVY